MEEQKPCVIECQICETYSKYPDRCNLCTEYTYFSAKKIKSPPKLRTNKRSERMGANFEEKNNAELKEMVKVVTDLTPNSGAGRIKGDEQLTGLISIMEELKTSVVAKYSRGQLTFTIRKNWLEKLKREAEAENKEFYYLKFKFLETDPDTYVIVDEPMLMSIIATMLYDRKISALANAKIEAYKANFLAEQAKLAAVDEENRKLKTELEYYKKLVEPEKWLF